MKCSVCLKTTSVNGMHPERKNKCYECGNAYKREWRKARHEAHPEIRAKQLAQASAKAREPKIRFSAATANAKRRHIEWLLTFEEYEAILGSRCHYCGGSTDETGVGLDRRVNAKGYVVDNVVSTCGMCNRMKAHVLTETQMLVVGELLREWRAADQLGPTSCMHVREDVETYAA